VVVIAPESTEYRRVEHANISCRSGAHAWCSLEVDPIPAAGHLGVIEEKCNTPHADEKRPGLNLLRRVGGWVCPNCGATV
jgi:hypothetical protein